MDKWVNLIGTIAHLFIATATLLLAYVAALKPYSAWRGLKILSGRVACVKEWGKDLKVNDKIFWLQLSVVNRGFSDQTLTMLQSDGFVIMPFSDKGFGYEVIVKARNVTKFKIPLEQIDTLDKANYLVLVNDMETRIISSREEIQEAVKVCREYIKKYH